MDYWQRNRNALYFVRAIYFVRRWPSLGAKLGIPDEFSPNCFPITPPRNGNIGNGYRDLLESSFKVGENSPMPKKIWKISFLFWLVSVCLQKIGYSHFFAGGAWKLRRTTYADFEYKIWKVFGTPIHCKSLRCLRWWITWKLTEQKKNFKNCILGGGFHEF